MLCPNLPKTVFYDAPKKALHKAIRNPLTPNRISKTIVLFKDFEQKPFQMTTQSLKIKNIKEGMLYGVQICAFFDENFGDFPKFVTRSMSPLTLPFRIEAEPNSSGASEFNIFNRAQHFFLSGSEFSKLKRKKRTFR